MNTLKLHLKLLINNMNFMFLFSPQYAINIPTGRGTEKIKSWSLL